LINQDVFPLGLLSALAASPNRPFFLPLVSHPAGKR